MEKNHPKLEKFLTVLVVIVLAVMAYFVFTENMAQWEMYKFSLLSAFWLMLITGMFYESHSKKEMEFHALMLFRLEFLLAAGFYILAFWTTDFSWLVFLLVEVITAFACTLLGSAIEYVSLSRIINSK